MQKGEYAKAFGEHLKRLLEEKGMTQAEFARRTGLTEPSVSRYIKGERTPRILQAYRIACVLGVDMNTLTAYLKEGEKQ